MDRLAATLVPWAPRCVLAESPRWYAGHWWWIDAQRGLVFRRGGGPRGTPADVWLSTGGRVSLVHPAGERTMLVARGPVLQYCRETGSGDGDGNPGGTTGGHASPGPQLAALDLPDGWLLNDGTAGVDGGLFIGVVHPSRDPGSGYLQHIRPDGTLAESVPGIGLSNGLALDPAATLLYHADSTGRVVLAHRLDPSGQITVTDVHLRFDASDGMPDGLATDAAGGLWVALYGAGQVRRYTPDGQIDLVVDVPTPQVTSVAIGGPDGRDLLITTAREGYDERRSAAEPLAGRLFAARSAHSGRALLSVRPPAD
jgi:sugar lactone lactonase YvrE